MFVVSWRCQSRSWADIDYPAYIGTDKLYGDFTTTILKATKYATSEEAHAASFSYVVKHPELLGKVSVLALKYKKNGHPYTEGIAGA